MQMFGLEGHETHLLDQLQKQQRSLQFCDTLLQTDGISVPTHGCVLAALSPYFSERLSTTSPPPFGHKRQLRVQTVRASTLLKLVGLLYSGRVEVIGDTEGRDVLEAARQFGIKNLRQENVAEEDWDVYTRCEKKKMKDAEVQVTNACDRCGTEKRSCGTQTSEVERDDHQTVSSPAQIQTPDLTSGPSWTDVTLLRDPGEAEEAECAKTTASPPPSSSEVRTGSSSVQVCPRTRAARKNLSRMRQMETQRFSFKVKLRRKTSGGVWEVVSMQDLDQRLSARAPETQESSEVKGQAEDGYSTFADQSDAAPQDCAVEQLETLLDIMMGLDILPELEANSQHQHHPDALEPQNVSQSPSNMASQLGESAFVPGFQDILSSSLEMDCFPLLPKLQHLCLSPIEPLSPDQTPQEPSQPWSQAQTSPGSGDQNYVASGSEGSEAPSDSGEALSPVRRKRRRSPDHQAAKRKREEVSEDAEVDQVRTHEPPVKDVQHPRLRRSSGRVRGQRRSRAAAERRRVEVDDCNIITLGQREETEKIVTRNQYQRFIRGGQRAEPRSRRESSEVEEECERSEDENRNLIVVVTTDDEAQQRQRPRSTGSAPSWSDVSEESPEKLLVQGGEMLSFPGPNSGNTSSGGDESPLDVEESPSVSDAGESTSQSSACASAPNLSCSAHERVDTLPQTEEEESEVDVEFQSPGQEACVTRRVSLLVDSPTEDDEEEEVNVTEDDSL